MISRTSFLALAIAAAGACVPSAAFAMASAELYSTKPYFYGRFEARIRFAAGDGVVSSFFLWKEGSDAANAYWNELDLEKFGANCSLQTNCYYGKPAAVHNQTASVSGNLCGDYHDYSIEWTSTYISFSVDGKEIRRETGATATAYAQNATAGMTMHFNIWPGNSSFGGDISKTTLPVQQFISWVQYSSYDNGNFTVQWREEFQTSGVPTDWAVGNWASPYNLSTHNEKNVSFVNGIAVLSLTSDSATGYSGTPPVDPNASTGTGGSPGSGGTTSGSGGSGGNTSGQGGATGTGGANTGGTKGNGGATGTGGTNTGGKGNGGATGTGGTVSSGGNTGSAGTITGGTKGSGGMTSVGGASGADGGASGSAGTGGTTASGTGGSAGLGGETGTGGTSTTGTEETGGTSGTTSTEAGCSCSTARSPGGFLSAIFILVLVALRLRRKEI